MDIPSRFTVKDDDPDLLWRFTAYIREVVKYARLEFLRKLEYQKREAPLEQSDTDMLSYESPLPADKDDFDFAEDKLSQAFSKLNLMRRRMLTLIFVEGLSAQETADRLGCSVDYVYLQKHRALKALRDQLMDRGGKHGE